MIEVYQFYIKTVFNEENMKKAKTNTLILILIAVIILSIPIITLAADPPAPAAKY